MSRARVWAGSALLGAALVAVGATAVRKQLRDGNDFPLYWQGARALLAGQSPYDVASGLHGYVYLPWFAWLLSPLTWLPLPVAAAIWYGANVTFLSLTVRELRAALAAVGWVPRTRTLVLAALPLAGLAHDNLVLGQANLFLLWLVAVTVRGAVEPASGVMLRGAALGLAAALKMSAALFAGPWLVRLRFPRLLAAAIGVAVAVLVPLALSGFDTGLAHLADWRAKVLTPAAAGTLQGSKVIDQSPHAGLRRLLVDEPAFGTQHVNVASFDATAFAGLSRVVAVGMLAACLLVWLFAPARHEPRAMLLDLALAGCAMVQVTGFHLKAQFVVLLLPAWAAAASAWAPEARTPRAVRVLLWVAAALFLLSQPGLVGRTASNWLLAYSSMAWGTLLLAAAVVTLRFRVAGDGTLATPSPSAARVGERGTGTGR